ncbi:MAG: hypothetical protein FJ387_30525 [Verrucomicrobia bacterium]|nr:hypothetical protein [Verrucomicrobiota bacterium]
MLLRALFPLAETLRILSAFLFRPHFPLAETLRILSPLLLHPLFPPVETLGVGAALLVGLLPVRVSLPAISLGLGLLGLQAGIRAGVAGADVRARLGLEPSQLGHGLFDFRNPLFNHHGITVNRNIIPVKRGATVRRSVSNCTVVAAGFSLRREQSSMAFIVCAG